MILRCGMPLIALLAISTFVACKQTSPPNVVRGNTNAIGPSPAVSSSGQGDPKHSGATAVSVLPGGEVHIRAGSSADAAVTVVVQDGFHVNANPPSLPSFIATQVTLQSSNGLAVGKPVYPAPSAKKKFQFSDAPLAVYEGSVIVKVPVKAAAGVPKGSFSLKGKVRAQPCDEEVCYPPRDLEVAIPVVIE
jgi:DsbC/DsbD-like thiol-disulfide interchange protein